MKAILPDLSKSICQSWLQTHSYRHISTDTFLQTHSYRHIPTDTFPQTHSYRHIPTETFVQTHSHRHIPTDTFPQTHSYRHIPTDTFPQTHSHRHIPTETFLQTHSHRNIPTDTFLQTHSHRHIPTDTFLQTHSHRHIPTPSATSISSQLFLLRLVIFIAIRNWMEQSPATEANSFLASQKIPHIWKQAVYYRVHDTPLLVPILAPINPVHTPIFMIHFNIILPSNPKFTKWFPSLKFSYRKSLAPYI